MQPLVLGAGPAGSVASMLLARRGAEPVLIDRSETVGDTICGGFLSWRTVKNLKALGCDPEALGAQQVTRLRMFAGTRSATVQLPEPAFGLSRRALDQDLRELAIRSGARLAIDQARQVGSGTIFGADKTWKSKAIFLATGKFDVRGARRPREAADPTLGFRVRIPHSDRLARLVSDAVELHLFKGGYGGIVLQEDGSANICLAVRTPNQGRE